MPELGAHNQEILGGLLESGAEAMQEGMRCAAPGATVVAFTPGEPGQELSLDMNRLYFNDISLVTSYSCGPTDTADALDILRSGRIKAEQLVTHRFPIERTHEAFSLTAEARESLKCMVVFG